MKKCFWIVFCVMLLFNISACSGKKVSENSVQSAITKNTKTDVDSTTIPKFVWFEDISLPVPKPNTASIIKDKTGLKCSGVTENDLKNFESGLIKDHWILVQSNGVNITYIKDNMTLGITDQTDKNAGNYIRVAYCEGYIGASRKGAISKPEAAELIQKNIDALDQKDYAYGKKIKYLIEDALESAFKKMGSQAYTAYGTDGFIGSYLVKKDSVLPVIMGFGQTCVADIDRDGQYELLSMLGWGSGIYRIELSAYKFGIRPNSASNKEALYMAYKNCWVPQKGFDELKMKQISDDSVKLYGTYTNENGESVLTEDYGLLKVEKRKGELLLVPSETEKFPFREWGIQN